MESAKSVPMNPERAFFAKNKAAQNSSMIVETAPYFQARPVMRAATDKIPYQTASFANNIAA